MQIFIVVGSTGESDDRVTWNAKSFRDEEQAKAHIREIKEELQRLEGLLQVDESVDWLLILNNDVAKARVFDSGFGNGEAPMGERGPFQTKLKTLDPRIQRDYNGAWYRIEEIELVDATD